MKPKPDFPRPEQKQAPKVSLVIPMRNEQESLAELLTALQAQTFRADEIILVDGGSTDDTVSLARQLTSDDERFRIIQVGDATPGRARNVGIELARNDWIALTDAGNRAEPQWLEQVVERATSASDVDIVFGNYEPIDESFFTRCAALAYVPAKQLRDGGLVRGPSIVTALMRRDVWTNIGGFPDLRAAEDFIFLNAVEQFHFHVAWSPTATVWWHLQPTLGSTYKKFHTYSRCNVWAGQQRFWHYGIARMYLLALPFLVLALVHNPLWLLVPGAGLVARVFKSIWQRREGRSLGWAINPVRFLMVGLIILTIDAATFAGWIEAILHPQRSIKTQRNMSDEFVRERSKDAAN